MHRNVLSDVITFMYHIWYRRSRQRDKLARERAQKGEDGGSPKFEPNISHILGLLDAAVYLDLPELADNCADIAAQYIEGDDNG